MIAKNIRAHIVDVLIQLEKEESYIQLVLKTALEDLEPKDKAFVNEVVYGTIKYQIKLDYVINQFSKVTTKKMKPFIRQLMRMSVYQLMYLDKVPASAVINEAVKMVQKRKMNNLSGFVNGVLRTISRNQETINYPDAVTQKEAYLSVMYAVPEWIVKVWRSQYTDDVVEEMLQALNERARVCIRRNKRAGDYTGFEEILKEDGIILLEEATVEDGYYVHIPKGVHHSSGFQTGEFSVQDESAMLVGHVVAPKSGEKILDMCSAPGGKTTHLAELMGDEGEIIALDIHEHKITLIEKQAERLGLESIHPKVQDGTVFVPEWEGAFDRVLLDAPCSGLGIMKRKPDIRHKKQLEDLAAINQIQKDLAACAVRYLKPGGVLVYSTCTLTHLENQQMAKHFIEVLGLEKNAIEPYLPQRLKTVGQDEHFIEILPQTMHSDGFFIARFKKKEV